jgi:antirestriction protein
LENLKMVAEQLNPRVYVACLASYNAGRLHGTWLDVEDVDSLQEGITGMLATSPIREAEEWDIHDVEGFGEAPIREYESLERVASMATLVREHGKLASALISHYDGDVEETTQALEDNYQGCYASLEDYAAKFMEDTGSLEGVPESIRPYIDYERIAHDWELNGDIFTVETAYNEVHVFWNR